MGFGKRIFKGLSEPKRFALEFVGFDGKYGPPIRSLTILSSRSGIPSGFEIASQDIPELDQRLARYSSEVSSPSYGHPEMARSSDALRKQLAKE